MTGKEFYKDSALLLQNATKLSTDYNGTLGYKYQAMMPEAILVYRVGVVGRTAHVLVQAEIKLVVRELRGFERRRFINFVARKLVHFRKEAHGNRGIKLGRALRVALEDEGINPFKNGGTIGLTL